MARRCAFCDAEIPRGAPPEHVIPTWMGKFKPKGTILQHTTHPERRGEIEVPATRPIYRSNKFDLTADTVCEPCNHGWMSDLETWCSPLLTPMIQDQRTGLALERQVLLAQWIAKTALTWDQSMELNSRQYPLEFSRSLKQRRLPPPGGIVRLGRYRGSNTDLIEMVYDGLYRELPTDPVSPGPPEAHRTTIRIGKLITEFTVTEDAEPVVRSAGGDINDMLLTIWPSADVASWPPRLAFGDEAWESFIEAETWDRP